MSTKQPTRMESISNAYRSRTKSLAAAAARDAEADKVVVEEETPEEETPPLETPSMAWKHEEIVDFLDSSGIGVERDDLEAMTKAELLDRFVDSEG